MHIRAGVPGASCILAAPSPQPYTRARSGQVGPPRDVEDDAVSRMNPKSDFFIDRLLV